MKGQRMSRILATLGIVAMTVIMVGVGRTSLATSAQDASASLEGHPLVGSWVAVTPFGAAAETLGADGSFVAGYSPTETGPLGPAFLSSGVGVWESTGELSGRFTSVQALTDVAGVFLGTLTIDGHLEVSNDGQTFVDDSPETTLTYRDAEGAVVLAVSPYADGSGSMAPVTGTKMAVGEPGIPAATPSS